MLCSEGSYEPAAIPIKHSFGRWSNLSQENGRLTAMFGTESTLPGHLPSGHKMIVNFRVFQ